MISYKAGWPHLIPQQTSMLHKDNGVKVQVHGSSLEAIFCSGEIRPIVHYGYMALVSASHSARRSVM